MSSQIIVQMELLNNWLTFEVNTWLLEDLPLSHTLQNILYLVFTNNNSCLQHNTEYIIKSGYVYVFTFSTNHDSGTPKKLPSIFFLHFLRCSLSKDPPAPARSSWQIENTREPIPGERTAFALFISFMGLPSLFFRFVCKKKASMEEFQILEEIFSKR